MTTRGDIIAAAQRYWRRDKWNNEYFDAAGYADFVLASRDAEIQRLQMALADAEALEIGTAEKCDKLRAELVNALAACKAKDEALITLMKYNPRTRYVGGVEFGYEEPVGECLLKVLDECDKALAIQPDDSALKAWLGEPVAEVDDSGVVIVCRYDYKPKDKFYSPKGLK